MQNGVERAMEIVNALRNRKRLAIISYLDNHDESSFTELCFETVAGPMNPATFKHHNGILMDKGMTEKVERGRYRMTSGFKGVYEIIKKIIEYKKEVKPRPF